MPTAIPELKSRLAEVDGMDADRDGTKFKTTTAAHFVANDLRVLAAAVQGGGGIGLMPKVLVKDAPSSGDLVQVLEGWSSPVSGIYLFYPSRRQIPAALDAFIKFMRENKPGRG